MRNDVLLGILLTILNKPANSQTLSEKFELSKRSIFRYIDTLEAAGIPILRESGKSGGFSIMPEFTLDKNFFTTTEYSYLLDLMQSVDLPLNKNIHETVINKLSALSKSKNLYSDALISTADFYIDGTNWTDTGRLKDKLSLITRGLQERILLSIAYIDSDLQRTQRLIEPHTLVLKNGTWYIYSFCRYRNEFRLFVLNRITECSATKDSFERRAFSLDSAPWKTPPKQDRQIEITVSFTDGIKHLIEEWLGYESIHKPETAANLDAFKCEANPEDERISINATDSKTNFSNSNDTNSNPTDERISINASDERINQSNEHIKLEDDKKNPSESKKCKKPSDSELIFIAKQTVNYNNYLISTLLSLGSQLTVLSPPELIEAIKKESIKISGKYN